MHRSTQDTWPALQMPAQENDTGMKLEVTFSLLHNLERDTSPLLFFLEARHTEKAYSIEQDELEINVGHFRSCAPQFLMADL